MKKYTYDLDANDKVRRKSGSKLLYGVAIYALVFLLIAGYFVFKSIYTEERVVESYWQKRSVQFSRKMQSIRRLHTTASVIRDKVAFDKRSRFKDPVCVQVLAPAETSSLMRKHNHDYTRAWGYSLHLFARKKRRKHHDWEKVFALQDFLTKACGKVGKGQTAPPLGERVQWVVWIEDDFVFAKFDQRLSTAFDEVHDALVSPKMLALRCTPWSVTLVAELAKMYRRHFSITFEKAWNRLLKEGGSKLKAKIATLPLHIVSVVKGQFKLEDEFGVILDDKRMTAGVLEALGAREELRGWESFLAKRDKEAHPAKVGDGKGKKGE